MMNMTTKMVLVRLLFMMAVVKPDDDGDHYDD